MKALTGISAAEFARRRKQLMRMATDDAIPVSYTHLDVYKRQVPRRRVRSVEPRSARRVEHAVELAMQFAQGARQFQFARAVFVAQLLQFMRQVERRQHRCLLYTSRCV